MRLSIGRQNVEEMGLNLQRLHQGMADETMACTEPTREWHSIGDDMRMFTEFLTNFLSFFKGLHCFFGVIGNQTNVCAPGLSALFRR
jgi:hypothetical protein